MANSLRGDVELKAGDQTYTMRMSVNAIIKLEEHFDLGINDIAEMLGDEKRMRISAIRSVVFFALQDHHPDITEDETGEIITEVGFAATSAAITQAMRSASPEAAAKAGAENPPKAKRAGTGKAS